jgi:hypothetical protein
VRTEHSNVGVVQAILQVCSAPAISYQEKSQKSGINQAVKEAPNARQQDISAN